MAIIAVVVAVATAILQATALLILKRQIRNEHEWNRRKTALELAAENSIGSFREIRRQLERKYEIYEEGSDIRNVELGSDDWDLLDQVLNHLDHIGVAVKNSVADVDTVFDAYAMQVVAYHRWAKPYIAEQRRRLPLVWVDLDPLARSWESLINKRLSSLALPGKEKL